MSRRIEEKNMEQTPSYKQTFLIGVITLLIGAFIGMYLDSLKKRYDDKLEYFDLKVRSVDNYLNTPSIAKNELDIIWKNEKVENISSLTIELFNFSNEDFEKVPVTIELSPDKNEDIKVIAHRIEGEDKRVDLIDDISSSIKSKRISYSFTVNFLNRTDSDSPSVTVTFLLAGKLAPLPKVLLNKKGVKIRKYDSSNNDILSSFEYFAIFVIVVILFVAILYRKQAKREINSYRYVAEAIEHKLISESSIMNENSPVVGSLCIRDIMHEIRLYRWRRMDWFDRQLKPMPKRDDLHY